MKESEKPRVAPSEKPESLWWNLGLNILIPVLVLRQGDKFIAS